MLLPPSPYRHLPFLTRIVFSVIPESAFRWRIELCCFYPGFLTWLSSGPLGEEFILVVVFRRRSLFGQPAEKFVTQGEEKLLILSFQPRLARVEYLECCPNIP